MLIFAGLIGLFPKNLPKKNEAIKKEMDSENGGLPLENNEKHDSEETKVQLKSKFLPLLNHNVFFCCNLKCMF